MFFIRLFLKFLANKLKLIIFQIIYSNQSAFILDRLIAGNVLATYETIHTMNSCLHGKEGFMAVKLDISKMYDMIEWRFLKILMEKIFSQRRINMIM